MLTIKTDDSSLGKVKFTQPVLVWKLWEEYRPMGIISSTLSCGGSGSCEGDSYGVMTDAASKVYQPAFATCLYMIQWSYLDIYNSVLGLAKHMTVPREAHA